MSENESFTLGSIRLLSHTRIVSNCTSRSIECSFTSNARCGTLKTMTVRMQRDEIAGSERDRFTNDRVRARSDSWRCRNKPLSLTLCLARVRFGFSGIENTVFCRLKHLRRFYSKQEYHPSKKLSLKQQHIIIVNHVMHSANCVHLTSSAVHTNLQVSFKQGLNKNV